MPLRVQVTSTPAGFRTVSGLAHAVVDPVLAQGSCIGCVERYVTTVVNVERQRQLEGARRQVVGYLKESPFSESGAVGPGGAPAANAGSAEPASAASATAIRRALRARTPSG
jgi:hypothetical protein